jgi:serine protease Do
VVKLDDKPIQSAIDLRKVLYKDKKIGDSIKVSYYRDGKLHETTATLGELKY